MEFKHIKGIGPAKQDKLKTAGVKDVHALARCDAEAVAQKSGIGYAQVKEWKARATGLVLLEDLKGVGPATVATLAEQGIVSLQHLYKASSARLAKELEVAQNKVQAWQAEAKKTAERIAKEAQTTAGRKSLVVEGRDFAQKTAQNAQETTKQVIAFVQKESQVLQAKAKDLQARYPVVVAQVKGAAHDAQVLVQDVAGKTQAAVKAEVQKVKAANEQFIARTKARVQKPQA